ncbi:uncharacterized protein F4822DRAFT_426329 [Hypoxylon trugodes]|uniref:uncharacterized protein n=1 Tax=Hypoxylon trugodes TaxID=326681 RepID=UPI0021A0B899|nr:uncharacterized protein F4822DRAFT_426329 [Hypoxylon trugodes]KAI1390482.1 hypothetical protein F4822DRAFT_426329 [Hypoxylon trugodes]
MRSQFTTTSALFVFDLLAGVTALPGWPGGGTLVNGNAVQFDRETWERNLAQPNATGTFSVIGYDISQKWPSSQVDGWTLSVNVSSDVPDSQTLNPNNATGKTFTGTSIFLKAPDSIQSAFTNQSALDETTWKICVAVIPNAPQEDSSTKDNGTCGYLSSQCITDLQQAYAKKFPGSEDCYGTPPSTPSSCGSSVNTANFQVQQLPLNSVNGTEVYVTASDSHDAGDQTAWNNAIKQAWPVLTLWGYNTRAKAPDGTLPQVQLSCIRADNVAAGSEKPSSGSRYYGSAMFAIGVTSFVALYGSF